MHQNPILILDPTHLNSEVTNLAVAHSLFHRLPSPRSHRTHLFPFSLPDWSPRTGLNSLFGTLAARNRRRPRKQTSAAPSVPPWMTLTRRVSFNIPIAVGFVRSRGIDREVLFARATGIHKHFWRGRARRLWPINSSLSHMSSIPARTPLTEATSLSDELRGHVQRHAYHHTLECRM